MLSDKNGWYNLGAVQFVTMNGKTGLARLHFSGGSSADTATPYSNMLAELNSFYTSKPAHLSVAPATATAKT